MYMYHWYWQSFGKIFVYESISTISGSDIEAKDRDNFTPLLLAASYGHANIVQLLLERGADATVEDKNDKTAVFLAAEEDKLEALEVKTIEEICWKLADAIQYFCDGRFKLMRQHCM